MSVAKGSRGWRQVWLCVGVLSLAACGGGGGGGGSTPTPNSPPLAAAGSDRTVFKGELVELSGGASSDADGHALTYSWIHKSGPTITLSNPTAVNPSFTAPSVSGVIVFELAVTDGRATATDEVSITVQNRVPTALAGDDFHVAPGASVTLSAPESFDPDDDSLTFTWTQTFGTTVTLTSAADGSAVFQAPAVSGLLRFSVLANDGELNSNEDSIVVAVGYATTDIPFADAGFDQIAPRNQDVGLWGWGSDSSGGPLTFSWQQMSGPAVTLNGAATPYPTFRSPATPAVLEFDLTVNNGVFSSLPARVVVEVRNFAPTVAGTLSPGIVLTSDDVIANVMTSDADGDALTVEYAWRKNGSIVAGVAAPTFPHDQQAKGDVLELTVSANDGFETATATLMATVQDTPATYQASPPTQIEHGDTFAFTVVGSDLDGDPVGPFNLLHGPAGMTVDADGNVSWVARLPMFGPELDVNYAITAQEQPSAYAGKVTVRDANRAPLAMRTGLEIPMRDGGLVIADLDGDGDEEMLIASYDSVHEYAWDGSDYVQRWVYPYYLRSDYGITIAAADVQGDAAEEIFIATGNRILKLDAATRGVTGEFQLTQSNVCKKIEIGDLDANGDFELVCLAATDAYSGPARLVVLDPVTMESQWQSIEFGGGSLQANGLAIGNVDADAPLEIVTGPGYVFDGATQNAQWAYGSGFGTVVDTGDLNGDGIEEIVGILSWQNAKIFDAVLRSPIAEITGYSGGTAALLVRDVEGSVAAEILIGDAQWGNFTGWRFDAMTSSAVQIFQIGAQGHGVSAIGVGDTDGDGSIEFVWGTDASSSGPDSLVVAGRSPAIAVEWINDDPKQLTGTFHGGMIATTALGERRFIFGTSGTDNGYAGARFMSLDPATLSMSVSSQVGNNWSSYSAFPLDAIDYDGDGIDELLIGVDAASFAAYDLAADTQEWLSPSDVGAANAITHADFTEDARPEMVAIAGSRVHVFDVASGDLVWRSVSLTQSGQDVAVANLEGDATPEIVAATTDRITLFKRHTTPAFIEAASVAVSGVIDLLVADADGDGESEIYVLAGQFWSDSTIHKFSASLQPIATFSAGADARSLHLEDLPTSARNLVVSNGDGLYLSQNRPHVRAIDPRSGAEIWRSPELAMPVTRNSLFYTDLDSDGEHQISFAAGPNAYVTQ